MNCKVIILQPFERASKRLLKRYKSLRHDLIRLIAELEANPMLGADLGNGFRKVRLAIKSKSSGKRGGARVITLTILLSTDNAEDGLLYIYDKSDRGSISIKELNALKKESGL